MSRDPIRLSGWDYNLFRFEFGSPFSNIDPSGLKVSICTQISNDPRLGRLGIRHVWLKTDRYESGMQPDPNRRSEKSFMNDPTWTEDHSNRPNDGTRECSIVTDVDESCVNAKIAPGQIIHNWTGWYACSDFVLEVLEKCKKKKKKPMCPVDKTGVSGVANE